MMYLVYMALHINSGQMFNFEDVKVDEVLNTKQFNYQLTKQTTQSNVLFNNADCNTNYQKSSDAQFFARVYLAAMHGNKDAVKMLNIKNPLAQYFYTRYLEDTFAPLDKVTKRYKKLSKKCKLALDAYIFMLNNGCGVKQNNKKAERLSKKTYSFNTGTVSYYNFRCKTYNMYPEEIYEKLFECVDCEHLLFELVEDYANLQLKLLEDKQ